MQKEKQIWYASWFNTPYYHLLYKDRNHREAAHFMNELISYLELHEKSEILDLACGKGRHSKFLFKKGFDVTGVDLSSESIEAAKKYEQPGLHFQVHDMCEPFPKEFDAVLNLFTSFGYFENEEDNLRTIKAIKEELKPEGHAVIDFLNAELIIKNLVPKEKKKVGDITFHLERYVKDDYIIKEIKFEDKGQEFIYFEKVKALTLNNFKAYFKEAGVQLNQVFGDYHLNDFNVETSPRLILVFSK